MDDTRLLTELQAILPGNMAFLEKSGKLLYGNLSKELHLEISSKLASISRGAQNFISWQSKRIKHILLNLPSGSWLYLNDKIKAEKEKHYENMVVQALPYIAHVAGGDAVLFDQSGRRIYACDADGVEQTDRIGVINPFLAETMSLNRPSIGPTFLRKDCTAVRIPLNERYGLSFNNKRSVKKQNRLLAESRRYSSARYSLEDIIGESKAICDTKRLARTAAKSTVNVLLTGATGTGKELFAHAIHNLSQHSMHPFIAINCGAIPDGLVESTLFGYIGGAFTGANPNGQLGAFEQANGGTLFLDEISEMPLDIQVKLLRAIQEREIIRVGDNKPYHVSVKIIASTNKDLNLLVHKGSFRSDLYYRLNVLEIKIPSLRERSEDISFLTEFFLRKFNKLMGKSINDIEPKVLTALKEYSWPGNIRELQNCIEYMCNLVPQDCYSLIVDYLPPSIPKAAAPNTSKAEESYAAHMNKAEKEFLDKLAQTCAGNKSLMARKAKLNRTTLWRIMSKYNL